MPANLDSSYQVYMVKYNRGTVVRLTLLNDLIKYIKTGIDNRTEIEIVSKTGDSFNSELWDVNSMIWYSLTNPRIHEATCLDKLAEEENKLARRFNNLPDIDPGDEKSSGTLIKVLLVADVIEGQTRLASKRKIS